MAHEWDDMLASLPAAYRKDAWVIALLGAIADADSAQRADADETAQQMFPDSMTWVLAIEERIAGITSAAGATPEERRSVLQAKWRSATGKCDLEKIKTVCGSWDGIAAEVTYDGASCITVLFRSSGNMPGNMDSVRAALRAVIPAHLRYEITAQLLRQAAGATRLAAAGTRAKHYGEQEVTL